MAFAEHYRGKRVFITGHSGFKGAWLSEWLLALGAEVTGYSLPPPTEPALFVELGLVRRLRHIQGDVRDLAALRAALEACRPDFIFHLAAQSLVRVSYQQPVETYATNVLGTVNLLEAARLAGRPCAMVAVTTDKCYENREWIHSYREEDPLGGYDPYSSSKGAAELAIAAYRRSFFSLRDSPIRLASVRAGNVVGGGDWALDRLVPDSIRSLQNDQPIPMRNPGATRPWQHVLEPLSGYLWLAASLATPGLFRPALASAFNFGPELASNRTVAEVVREILRHWPGRSEDRSDPHAVHEAGQLNLSTDKAFHLLRWRPVWDFEATVAQTVAWYQRRFADPAAAVELTTEQIAAYTAAAQDKALAWATTA